MAITTSFSQRMSKRGDQVVNAGARAIRRGGRAFLKSVVLGTPVDTGEHRSNWRVGVGRRPGGVIKPYAPGKKLGIEERANAFAAIAAGNAQLEKVRPGRGRSVDFAVTIVNNAPVIDKINAGLISNQQTPGFVDIAFMDARIAVKGVKIFTSGIGD